MYTINTRKPNLPEGEEDQYRYCWIQFKRAKSICRDWDFYFYMEGQLTRMSNKQYGRSGCRTAFQNEHVRTHLYYEHVYRCLMFLMKEKDFDFEKVVFYTDDEKIFFALNEYNFNFDVYEQCSYNKGKPLRELQKKKCHVIYNPEPSKEWEKINSVEDVISLNTLKAPQPNFATQAFSIPKSPPKRDPQISPLLVAKAKLAYLKNKGSIRVKEETADPEYCWVVSRTVAFNTRTFYHYNGVTVEWKENSMTDTKAQIERHLLAQLSRQMCDTTFVTTYPYTAQTINRSQTKDHQILVIRKALYENNNRLVSLSELSSSFDKTGYSQLIRNIDQMDNKRVVDEEIDFDAVMEEIKNEKET